MTISLDLFANELEILVSFFFLVLFPVSVTWQTFAYCIYPLSCGVGEPQIHPPFRLDGRQRKVCGYPGFDLSCNSSNRTVLQLPNSGQLFVKDINYTSQEMQIYDPDNCLPRRLLKLRFPRSFPYKLAGLHQDYTFLNCSSSSVDVTNISPVYAPISCLSSSTHTILATRASNLNAPLDSSCKLIATVLAPEVTLDGFSYKISDVLLLIWQLLPDRSLVKQSLNFENVRCNGKFYDARTVGTTIVIVILSICIALPVLVIFVCFICPWVISALLGDRRNLFTSDGILRQSTDTNQVAIVIRTGPDNPTIKTYRRILLDEKLQLPNPNDTTCSICLSEYRPTETLKIVPLCNHYFHAKCIDPWLRMHTTCPVCRKSLQHSILLPAADAS